MRRIILPALVVSSAIALTGCSKLGNLSADNFNVTPTPLEVHGGQVVATINGTFPEKYMKKKAVVTVNPVLVYANGETAAQGATFQGEKVMDNNTTIKYKVGGNYTMKATFPYNEDMLNSDLYARFDAKVGKKVKKVSPVKIGYGVIGTSELLGGCLKSSNGSIAADAYQRVIEQKQEATIKFLIGQATLRASELKSNDVKDMVNILREINDQAEERALQNIEVSAYASPDGKFSFNEKLAEKRQNVSTDYVRKQMKEIGVDGAVTTKFTAEDWDGFQQLISQSNFQDKDLILRVLSMYEDPEEREAKIKEMGAIYPEIAKGIMPELRRARMIVNYQVIGRSDAQITEAIKGNAKELSVEEMLYAANKLAQTKSEKKDWYEKTIKQYPNDYRAYNNLAQLNLVEGNLNKAEELLAKATKLNKGASEVGVNKALSALLTRNVTAAESALSASSGANGYSEMLGNLNIAKGNYAQAAKQLAGANTNSAALAQILNKDYAAARNTLQAIKSGDATTSYLKAVLAARNNDANNVVSNLREAIKADSSYAKRAANDLEFSNFASAIANLVK